MDGVLVAAYGRVYLSEESVISDFHKGKDFIFYNPSSPWNGKYCSIRDFNNGQKLELRYGMCKEYATIVTVI